MYSAKLVVFDKLGGEFASGTVYGANCAEDAYCAALQFFGRLREDLEFPSNNEITVYHDGVIVDKSVYAPSFTYELFIDGVSHGIVTIN